MKQTILSLILTGALASTSFAANINQRRENQQDRIAGGIQHGQLNAREAANLETREFRVNREIRNDRAHNDGRLTRGERYRINQQQNRISNSIYRDRHN